MKISKLLFSMILMLGFSMVGISQNKKMLAKGEEKATQINQEIVSVSPDLALKAEQIKSISKIHADKLVQIKAIKKEGLPKEEEMTKIKTLNKEAGKKINMEILTKKQRQAFRKAKQKAKE